MVKNNKIATSSDKKNNLIGYPILDNCVLDDKFKDSLILHNKRDSTSDNTLNPRPTSDMNITLETESVMVSLLYLTSY